MCTIWSICLSEADIYAIYAYLCVQPELACTLLSGVEVMEVFMNASYGIFASLNPINKSSGFSWTIQTFQTYHVGNIVGDLILWWFNIYLIYNIYNIYNIRFPVAWTKTNSITPQASGEHPYQMAKSTIKQLWLWPFLRSVRLPCSPQHYCHKHHVNLRYIFLACGGPLWELWVGIVNGPYVD